MKDSKTVRDEHQSFVDAWKKIQEDNSSTPVAEGSKSLKDMTKTPKKGYKTEKVLVRKSGAFTALAEKYNMSPKQFGRYVEANQHLFDIPTRKKAILANKFQGFKETKEWDEFFGDLELVESNAPYVVHTADKKGNTPAWQGYVEGKINEVTGEPLYVAGDDLQEKDTRTQITAADIKLNSKAAQEYHKDPNAQYGTSKRFNPIIKGLVKKNDGVKKGMMAHNELEGEDLQEITTKDTKSGTKFKVRVKDKKTGSSYIRFATRDKISQLRSDPKIASVEMTDEGQTPEERGEKKAQAAGGGNQKMAKKDYDGDGKVETGSQEYLGSRDKAIKKAMKKRSVTTEAQSNWREDLKEIMGEVEKAEEKKKEKGKKAKNKIAINPDTDDEKNKYEEVNAKKLAENLGADLQSLKIEDADGNVAYEVVDLVKPDPITEADRTAIENMSGNKFKVKVGDVVDKVKTKLKNFMKKDIIRPTIDANTHNQMINNQGRGTNKDGVKFDSRYP